MKEIKKEIFIKIDEIDNIIQIMEKIEKLNNELVQLFYKVDELKKLENKVLDNWSYYLEDISQKVDYLTL